MFNLLIFVFSLFFLFLGKGRVQKTVRWTQAMKGSLAPRPPRRGLKLKILIIIIFILKFQTNRV